MEQDLIRGLPLGRLEREMAGRACFVGFDGFVDTLLRPLRREPGGQAVPFATLAEFAAYLAAKGQDSAAVDCTLTARKAGGNNPLLCAGLARLGAAAVTVGAYGEGAVDPVFAPLAAQCELHSFAGPGLCFAYEFDVNKVMTCVGLPGQEVLCLDNLDRRLPPGVLRRALGQAELVALVNFGEQPAMLRLWSDLLEKVVPGLGGRRGYYFDLSDCAQVPDGQLWACLRVLRGYGRWGRTCLSVNGNEYRRLCALAGLDGSEVRGPQAQALRAAAGVDCLVVRTLRAFWGVSAQGVVQAPNPVVERPLCLTGAGDNQNAGICAGLLCGLPLGQALALGALAGRCYIRTGQPAGWSALRAEQQALAGAAGAE